MSFNRREFIKSLTAAFGACMSGAAFPEGLRRAVLVPPNNRTGTIRDVEHVVIFMQENRSFDHYFGSLRGVRGFGDPRPLQIPGAGPIWQQPNANVRTSEFHSCGVAGSVQTVSPFHVDTRESGYHQRYTDHGWSSQHLSWNHGTSDRWINAKQDVLTMGYLTRSDIPYHYMLADAFTICDSYFSSVLANTAPNRIYLWSGTCDPHNTLGRIPNGPGLEQRDHVNGYTWTTYPERLQAAGISWRVYQGGTGVPGSPTDNFGNNSLEYFATYQTGSGADANDPLVRNGVSSHTIAELRQDVLHGTLPDVSWIVTPKKNSEHPSESPLDGAYYVNLVLEALTADPESWSRTALFLCYDENDGLFDHVVPPLPPLINQAGSDGMVSPSLAGHLRDEFVDLDQHPQLSEPLVPNTDPLGWQPIGLGIRVPMIIISPWTVGGWVCSETFDHTSVLRFLEARYGVRASNISPWRRAVCGDLTSAFDFSRPPGTSMPPRRAAKKVATANRPITVPTVQHMPEQEPGARPARPIPYHWTIACDVDYTHEKLKVSIRNLGPIGTWFYAYDYRDAKRLPRRYAVAAYEEVEDFWGLRTVRHNQYHVAFYGPNGYLCEARGPTQAGVKGHTQCEVRVTYVPAHYTARVTVLNAGPAKTHAVVRDDYSGRKVALEVPAHSRTSVTYDLEPNGGWYDISVTLAGLPDYLRRFAGHLETGSPSMSDPGRSSAT